MRTEPSWSALLTPRLILPLAVLLGGNLLQSMNLLITATLLPSIVADIGGARLMSWPRPPSLPPRLLPRPARRSSARPPETGERFASAP